MENTNNLELNNAENLETINLDDWKYGKDNDVRLDRDFTENLATVKFCFFAVTERDDKGKVKSTKDLVEKAYNVTELPEAIKNRLVVHGLLAKLGDDQASNKDCKISDCVKDMDAQWERLVAGTWNAKKAKSERVKVTEDAITAGATALGMDAEQAMALLKQLGLYKG